MNQNLRFFDEECTVYTTHIAINLNLLTIPKTV